MRPVEIGPEDLAQRVAADGPFFDAEVGEECDGLSRVEADVHRIAAHTGWSEPSEVQHAGDGSAQP